MAKKKLKFLASRPADKSLPAFKQWILDTTKSLGGSDKNDLKEKEWRKAWKEFWSEDVK